MSIDSNYDGININKKLARFFYPNAKQFPFDEICEMIVRVLEISNFSMLKIKVDFDEFYKKFYYIEKIQGEDFVLFFTCRKIQNLESVEIGVSKLIIPKKILHVFKDESGPLYYTYVGENWKQDKQSFMTDLKINSKLYKEPRTYLMYRGRSKINKKKIYNGGERKPFLVHDNDSEREYDLNSNEPLYFETEQVFQEFNQWLNDNVFKKLVPFTEAFSLTSHNLFCLSNDLVFEIINYCYDEQEKVSTIFNEYIVKFTSPKLEEAKLMLGKVINLNNITRARQLVIKHNREELRHFLDNMDKKFRQINIS